MKHILIPITLLIIFIIGFVAWSTDQKQLEENPVLEQNATTTPEQSARTDAAFAWTYKTSEADAIPTTSLSLTATYADGTTVTKEIDSIQGSCNAYDTPDSDTYAQSDMVICYYAGLGYYFKVVETENGYDVQRREFEEGSPEYDPPMQKFETIASF